MWDTIRVIAASCFLLLFALATAARRFPDVAWLQPFRNVFPQPSEAERERARRRVNALVGAELILMGIILPLGYAALTVMFFNEFTVRETALVLTGSLVCIALGITAIVRRGRD
jgi:hypothetical protein